MGNQLIDNIDKLMKLHGHNEYDLAEKSGVPQPTINRIMNGKHANPRENTLEEIGKVYGVNTSQLRGHIPIDWQKIALEAGGEKNTFSQSLDKYNATIADSLQETPEFKEIKDLLETIGTDLKSASLNQLLVISKILKMKDENVSNTNELIEFIERIIRENSTRK